MSEDVCRNDHLASDIEKLSIINNLDLIEGIPKKKIFRISLLDNINKDLLGQLKKTNTTNETKKTIMETPVIKMTYTDISNIENVNRISKNIEKQITVLHNQNNLELEVLSKEIKHIESLLDKFNNKGIQYNEEEINRLYDLKIKKVLSFSPSPERDKFLEHIEEKRKKSLEDLKKEIPKTKADYINLIYELRVKKVQESDLAFNELKRQLIKIEIQRLKALRSLNQSKENINTTTA